MTIRVSPSPIDDREFYPLHEEDDVPEIPFHRRQVGYLDAALRARFPGWFVTGNVCIYWEPGNTSRYAAPDLFVVKEPLSEPEPRVYLVWQDPPVSFVVEIGSRSTFRADEGPKLDVYGREIRAAEYLYADPPNGDVRLWRLGSAGYEPVAPGANGRLRSMELELEFGLDEASFLRIYTLEGEPLRTPEEAEQYTHEVEEQLQEVEQHLRDARAQAAEEAAQRAELERQLAELRARLENSRTDGEDRARG
jgi:Uma2 family endonuclease